MSPNNSDFFILEFPPISFIKLLDFKWKSTEKNDYFLNFFTQPLDPLSINTGSLIPCENTVVTDFTGLAESGYRADFRVHLPESEGECNFNLSPEIKSIHGQVQNHRSFSVYLEEPDAVLHIHEVLVGGSPDFTEFLVIKSGTLKNSEYCFRNSCMSLPDRSVTKGDRIVLWSDSGTDDTEKSEGLLDSSWDFYNGKSLTATDGVISLRRKPALHNFIYNTYSVQVSVDFFYSNYWAFWNENASGFIDAFVYGNANGVWTGCGSAGNISCLSDLIQSGYWKIIRYDENMNPVNISDLSQWIESDSILNNGSSNTVNDIFVKCPDSDVSVNSKETDSPKNDWHYIKGNTSTPSPGKENTCGI